MHEDGLFGSGLAKLMATELPKHGFEIVETIAIPTPSRDLSNVVLRLRSLNPDLVIPSTYYGETVLLARTMQQQRVRPKARLFGAERRGLQHALRQGIPGSRREDHGLQPLA